MSILRWSSSQDPRATRTASSLSTTTFMRRKRCVTKDCVCVCFPLIILSLFYLLLSLLPPMLSSTFMLSSMRSPSWFRCLVVTPNTLLPSTLLSGPNRGGQSDWQQPQSWRCMIGYVRRVLYTCPGKKTKILFHSLPLVLKLALLSVSCCDSRGIQGPPSKQAIWSITCKGDIFVSEPSPALEAIPYPTPCDQM